MSRFSANFSIITLLLLLLLIISITICHAQTTTTPVSQLVVSYDSPSAQDNSVTVTNDVAGGNPALGSTVPLPYTITMRLLDNQNNFITGPIPETDYQVIPVSPPELGFTAFTPTSGCYISSATASCSIALNLVDINKEGIVRLQFRLYKAGAIVTSVTPVTLTWELVFNPSPTLAAPPLREWWLLDLTTTSIVTSIPQTGTFTQHPVEFAFLNSSDGFAYVPAPDCFGTFELELVSVVSSSNVNKNVADFVVSGNTFKTSSQFHSLISFRDLQINTAFASSSSSSSLLLLSPGDVFGFRLLFTSATDGSNVKSDHCDAPSNFALPTSVYRFTVANCSSSSSNNNNNTSSSFTSHTDDNMIGIEYLPIPLLAGAGQNTDFYNISFRSNFFGFPPSILEQNKDEAAGKCLFNDKQQVPLIVLDVCNVVCQIPYPSTTTSLSGSVKLMVGSTSVVNTIPQVAFVNYSVSSPSNNNNNLLSLHFDSSNSQTTVSPHADNNYTRIQLNASLVDNNGFSAVPFLISEESPFRMENETLDHTLVNSLFTCGFVEPEVEARRLTTTNDEEIIKIDDPISGTVLLNTSSDLGLKFDSFFSKQADQEQEDSFLPSNHYVSRQQLNINSKRFGTYIIVIKNAIQGVHKFCCSVNQSDNNDNNNIKKYSKLFSFFASNLDNNNNNNASSFCTDIKIDSSVIRHPRIDSVSVVNPSEVCNSSASSNNNFVNCDPTSVIYSITGTALFPASSGSDDNIKVYLGPQECLSVARDPVYTTSKIYVSNCQIKCYLDSQQQQQQTATTTTIPQGPLFRFRVEVGSIIYSEYNPYDSFNISFFTTALKQPEVYSVTGCDLDVPATPSAGNSYEEFSSTAYCRREGDTPLILTGYFGFTSPDQEEY